MRVLYELYRSEIHPDEENHPMLDELTAARKRFACQREAMLAELSAPVRERVQRLLDERMEAAALEMEDAYVRGMRMGARMAMALLSDKKDLPNLT